MLSLVDVKCNQVSYLFCPQYEGLSIKDIFARTKDYPQVLKYLPDQQDWHRLPRQWLINLFTTVVGKPFSDWVTGVLNQRNDDMAQKQNFMVDVDNEIAQIFAQSTSLSSKYTHTIHHTVSGSHHLTIVYRPYL